MEKFDIPFKKIRLQDMTAYIEKNDPNSKSWFKAVAIDGKGKYQHLVAVRAFCNKYAPELIPVKKEPAPNKSDVLKDW